VRELSSVRVLERRGGGSISLHDAFRPIAASSGALTSNESTAVRSALADLLLANLSALSQGRLSTLFRLLREIGQYKVLADICTDLAEWLREFGIAGEVRAHLEAATKSTNLTPADRFWLEDALGFIDAEQTNIKSLAERLHRMKSLVEEHGLGEGFQAALHNKQLLFHMTTGDLAAAKVAMERGLATATPFRRILKYNFAAACVRHGKLQDGLEIANELVKEYFEILGLEPQDVLFTKTDKLAARIRPNADVDEIRRLADSLDLIARALRRAGKPPGFNGLWSMKFYDLAGAPASAIKAGQDVVDDFMLLGDYEGARNLLEQSLIPAVQRFKLAEYVVRVHAHYAVVLAYSGDFMRSASELRGIEPYVAGLDAEASAELEGQRRLIERLRTVTPRERGGHKLSGSHAKVGRNEPCPCGSGKKFKRCCIGS